MHEYLNENKVYYYANINLRINANQAKIRADSSKQR